MYSDDPVIAAFIEDLKSDYYAFEPDTESPEPQALLSVIWDLEISAYLFLDTVAEYLYESIEHYPDSCSNRVTYRSLSLCVLCYTGHRRPG